MPPMPRAIAPPPTYTTGLELWPANIDPIPTIIASIGRYISVCWKLSGAASGISGGDWSRISPAGQLRRVMPFGATDDDGAHGRCLSGVLSGHERQRDWTGWSALGELVILRPHFRRSG